MGFSRFFIRFASVTFQVRKITKNEFPNVQFTYNLLPETTHDIDDPSTLSDRNQRFKKKKHTHIVKPIYSSLHLKTKNEMLSSQFHNFSPRLSICYQLFSFENFRHFKNFFDCVLSPLPWSSYLR